MARKQRSAIVHWPKRSARRDAAQRARLVVLAGDRRADHHPVEPQVPRQRLGRQPGDALAHQRPPGDRRRDRGEDRVARQPAVERLQVLRGTPTCAPRASIACSIASGRGSSASSVASPGTARASPASIAMLELIEVLVAAVLAGPNAAKRSISARVQASARSTRFGPVIARRRRHHRVRARCRRRARHRRRRGSGRRRG